MAAFKAHCAFSFPKANLINDPQKILEAVGKTAMGSFGQVKTLIDLPDDGYIKDLILQAVKLNEQETKIPVKKSIAKPVSIPDGLKSALERNDKAAAVFNKLSASHQREYCAYIAEAKKEETRLRRMEKTIAMLLQGKSLNADYSRK